MNNFQGLTQEEVLQKLKQYGPNEIQEVHRISPLQILLRQVKKNFVLYLLSITAIVSFLLGKEITGYVILIVIAIVVTTGFIQEYKAEKAISALRKMIMPISRVIRSAKEHEVPSNQIVPGDIVVLRTGEKIPADCVVLEESKLETNESILTGESTDVKKSPGFLSSYTDENLIYMGSYVVSGKCRAQVLRTGMNTKFGKIAGMISTAEKHLPLQDKVNNISKYMAIVGITAAVLSGIVLFTRAEVATLDVVINILIIVIALSVSSFPEGFPVVLTATLAYGVNRMAKQNAIVNRMSIIETLGETSVICSDKTGTLTKGEMTVRKIYSAGRFYDISGVGYEAKGEIAENAVKIDAVNNESLMRLIKCAIICNDSNIERLGTDAFYNVIGSSTEGALLIFGAKFRLFKESFPNPRIEEMPFDSQRKMMSVLYQDENEKVVYAKGAPEVILQKCTAVQTQDGIQKISDEGKRNILAVNQQLSLKSFRSLAFAYKVNPQDSYSEDEFIFLGLTAMEDPPREEVAEAIVQCTQSGIKVKMITGDNKETALAVAGQIGIVGDILTGEEIGKLSDDEMAKAVVATAIFARVKPEDKLRIVRALKANNEIVTMTGDGVNDAPALKEAHIGVAMGINGTDVSRSVADITLKDDNFATIVVAIKEGRTIFNNIRKFVTYQLSCNLSDIYILFAGILMAPYLGWYTPIITALQILFMNIVTDDLPAITLGFNETSKDIMTERPRNNANILTNEFMNVIILNGVSMGVIAFCVAYLSYNIIQFPPEVARTTVLISMIMVQIANAYNFRSFRYRVLNRGLMVNKYLFFASILSIIATFLIIYTPSLRDMFETTVLGIESWFIAAGAALTIVVIFDMLKTINNKTGLFLDHIH
ncbi:MAG: cation-transporting P-type ATPase [Candidatus Levybacteria bacterium]|nr:cation-transporting P-type ATPase [Candidatus Levybacteria bacterium]